LKELKLLPRDGKGDVAMEGSEGGKLDRFGRAWVVGSGLTLILVLGLCYGSDILRAFHTATLKPINLI